MINEIWKDVKGYEGLYQISNLGRVKSLNNYKRNKSKILKPVNSNGYKYIVLHNRGKNKRISIHRLIAIHFIDNPENKPQVNHINSIRNDNRIENLEWVTCSENIKHAYNVKSKIIGSYHIKRTKEVHSKKVKNIITGKIYSSAFEASKDLEFSYPYLCSMLNGNRNNKTNLIYIKNEKT